MGDQRTVRLAALLANLRNQNRDVCRVGFTLRTNYKSSLGGLIRRSILSNSSLGTRRWSRVVLALAAYSAVAVTQCACAEESGGKPSIYVKKNLVAWCIVPFDANRRTPTERAKMLKRLGLTRLAYDWRDVNVPTFEGEIVECKKHGIEFFAFWSWHGRMEELIKKHEIHPQIWQIAPSPPEQSRQAKVEASAKSLAPLVETTRRLGLKLGLYNHGDWGGEPGNLVAVCNYLRKHSSADHVGIVYNFHHGHAHIDDFDQAMSIMKPYLLCLNLNGMNRNESPKILPLGGGMYEDQMMQTVRDSGYSGPIGVIHHREEIDAEEGLRQNIDGLRSLLKSQRELAALETFED